MKINWTWAAIVLACGWAAQGAEPPSTNSEFRAAFDRWQSPAKMARYQTEQRQRQAAPSADAETFEAEADDARSVRPAAFEEVAEDDAPRLATRRVRQVSHEAVYETHHADHSGCATCNQRSLHSGVSLAASLSASYDGGCGDCGSSCCDLEGLDPFECGCGPQLWWINKEGLLWWRKGRALPSLVTSAASVNNIPGTNLLYGNRVEETVSHGGFRIDFGTWVNQNQCVGIGGRFWILGREDGLFTANSTQFPNQSIERPFLQAPNNLPNSLVVANPFAGQAFDGSIRVETTNNVMGADAYLRRLRCFTCNGRVDWIGGYQFARIDESLAIRSVSAAGQLTVDDVYRTRNEFHGGVIGTQWSSQWCRWNLNVLTRVGLGNMHQTVIARGATNGVAGGLLVETDNTVVTRDSFVSVPEINATLGYQITPCLDIHAGYSMIYFSNLARAERVIDFVRGDNVSVTFRDSGFWLQGVTAGLGFQF